MLVHENGALLFFDTILGWAAIYKETQSMRLTMRSFLVRRY
jgi:hypothetical protein